jgi:hypothetical protein
MIQILKVNRLWQYECNIYFLDIKKIDANTKQPEPKVSNLTLKNSIYFPQQLMS